MALSFTQTAAQQLRHYLNLRGNGLGVRLIAQPSQCEEMQYHLEFVDVAGQYDLVFDSHGERIYVDPKTLTYVDGTVIDFSVEDADEGFRIHNPNITHECGCGGSFQA